MTGHVLFAWTIQQSYREMLPLADHLQARGWRVSVLLGWRGPTSAAAAAACQARGFEVRTADERYCYVEQRDRVQEPGAPPVLDARRQATSPWRRLGFVPGHVRGLLQLRRYAASVIATSRPDVMLSEAFHSVGRLDNALTRAARKAGVLTATVPQSPYLGEENATHARFDNFRQGMVGAGLRVDADWVNRVLGLLRPRWTRQRDGVQLFMFDPLEILAARLVGLSHANPWRKPIEDFDVIFADSALAVDGVAGRYPETDILLVGRPTLDPAIVLAGDLPARQRVLAALGLDDEGYLLWNMEPAAEHHYLSWEEHLRRVRAIADALEELRLPVVISLHPLCRPDDYRFLEERGFKLALEHRIYELYPLAGVAVSHPCSTNLVAEVFGTPLVIIDFLGICSPPSPRWAQFRRPGAEVAETPASIPNLVRAAMAAGPRPYQHLEPSSPRIERELTARLPAMLTSKRSEVA